MPWLLRATDDCNNTLVQLAIESQNPKMVDLMLQLGAERDPTVAVFKDDASTLAQYIDSDRKLLNQTLSCDKYTLLHLSAKSGSTQSAMLLITKGATVDVLCRHEWTPLRYAVFHENDDVAGVLIDAGASRDIWIDAGLGDYNAVQVWLDTYPQLLNATDANGLTPLHWAAHRCRPEVAELLLEQGAEPNIRTDYIVGTPLMLATKARCADDVKRLLEKWDGRLE